MFINEIPCALARKKYLPGNCMGKFYLKYFEFQ